ncbi:MAG: hypothetical protein Q8907_15305 [Bacteroidota bacterium]|nr:hypothetical protein [Bacteroidota bacterium]MDP4227749.1 hypothetical protein [Bacteroidota bacterium]MDP4275638.1 hypothetical protein [Bacteroidota bacterium]
MSESASCLAKEDKAAVLEKLTGLISDNSTDKRSLVYRLADYLGRMTSDPKIKKQSLILLIKGLNDKDGAIVYTNLQALKQYTRRDFDLRMKHDISQKIQEGAQPHYELLVKIGGWLDIPDLNVFFRQKLQDKSGTTNRERWAMRLAMARMGEQDMVQYCLRKAEAAPLNDDAVYDLVPDLVYTRQKPIFAYLFRIIESDDRNCSSPNPDRNADIICAYGVIEKIAPVIVRFPLKTDKSGELVSNNSKEILSVSRKWIKETAIYGYEIENEKF